MIYSLFVKLCNIDGNIINSKGKELYVFRDLYLITDDTIKSGSSVIWAYYLYTLQLLELYFFRKGQ